MDRFKIHAGSKIVAFTPTFPSRRYWYRHDLVFADGVKLEGHIQVRHRHGRIETMTCFQDCCVIGSNVEWLMRMNWNAAHPM
jgi:hypothetical protein